MTGYISKARLRVKLCAIKFDSKKKLLYITNWIFLFRFSFGLAIFYLKPKSFKERKNFI